MIQRLFPRISASRAPEISGAVLCALFSLLLASCDRKGGTPDWDRPGEAPPAEAAGTATPAPAVEPAAEPAPETAGPAPEQAPAPAAPAELSTTGLRVLVYNVENWLTMDRYVDNKRVGEQPKPKSEKDQVIRIIASQTPDVVGLCEIGEASDLAEIQDLLAESGLKLPHSHYVGGSDKVRHLGILSRFPITATHKPAETDFKLQGQTYSINRGILDASIDAHGKSYRFLGVHLKSKRKVPEYDEEEMRVNEARLLRRHVDAIQKEDPNARLVVYGDFNDTRANAAVKAITGPYKSPGYLTAVPFKDTRGHAWTHHWAPHDIYSRIDFLMVSRPLRQELDFPGSYIVDDPAWHEASDHRALMAIFR